MTNESSFLSQTLQSITSIKKREQDKRKNLFEAGKAKLLQTVDASDDQRLRLQLLLAGFRDLSAGKKGVPLIDDGQDRAMLNIRRYLELSKSDPSVSMRILGQFEAQVREKLDQESDRFDFANLYYQLLGEWTSADSPSIAASERKDEDLDGSFEHIQKYNLQNLKDKFSDVVFTPLETDEVEIDMYLDSLFDDENAQSILASLREEVRTLAVWFKERPNPFNQAVLKECIQALLTNDLLSEDAKATMTDFSENSVVLGEIADVLNLRYADLDNWSWDADEGMYYEPRRQPNGKYRIMMDQDILQAIFLHYIAATWSGHLKPKFKQLVKNSKFWRSVHKPSSLANSRRGYFTGESAPPSCSVASDQFDVFHDTFLLSALPGSLKHTADPYDDSSKDENKKSGLEIRQLQLQQMATEVIIGHSLHGEVAIVQSDLQWYATGLPHSTIRAIMRFWGIPYDWLAFFTKFMEAPLRMDPTPGQNVRIRKRGIPITDAFEKLFGESVLWCMDVAVNRLSGMNLIRSHDDLWLCGKPSVCAHAWETIEDCVRVLGLDINRNKTGSMYISDSEKDPDIAAKFPDGPVCMGMLQLSETGKWTLDQKQVSAHVRQLSKQLGESKSIIAWAQIWNACMGRFFQNVFGKPTNCFGQAHVDSILKTFAAMQGELFEAHNGSVTDYLREQIRHRFGVADVPDSFFFLSEDLGGLGLQNPFVHFFLLKDQLIKDPLDRIEEFLEAEKKQYNELKESFEALTERERRRRYELHFNRSGDDKLSGEPFFSFEEYTSHREAYSNSLMWAYRDLIKEPNEMNVYLARDFKPLFEELRHSHNLNWEGMSHEVRWIMHLYAEELEKKFGSLSIINRNMLPSGVMKMLKKRKVVWQQIIWD